MKLILVVLTILTASLLKAKQIERMVSNAVTEVLKGEIVYCQHKDKQQRNCIELVGTNLPAAQKSNDKKQADVVKDSQEKNTQTFDRVQYRAKMVAAKQAQKQKQDQQKEENNKKTQLQKPPKIGELTVQKVVGPAQKLIEAINPLQNNQLNHKPEYYLAPQQKVSIPIQQFLTNPPDSSSVTHLIDVITPPLTASVDTYASQAHSLQSLISPKTSLGQSAPSIVPKSVAIPPVLDLAVAKHETPVNSPISTPETSGTHKNPQDAEIPQTPSSAQVQSSQTPVNSLSLTAVNIPKAPQTHKTDQTSQSSLQIVAPGHVNPPSGISQAAFQQNAHIPTIQPIDPLENGVDIDLPDFIADPVIISEQPERESIWPYLEPNLIIGKGNIVKGLEHNIIIGNDNYLHAKALDIQQLSHDD